MKSFVFIFPEEKKIKSSGLLKIDRTPFYLTVMSGEIKEAAVLDTFTDEVRKSGKLLLSLRGCLLLIDCRSGEIFEQSVDYSWSFIADLDKGPVRENLKTVSTLRAVVPVAGLKLRHDRGLVLDDETKTRVRIFFFTFKRKKKSLVLGVTRVLRGYEKTHDKVEAWLAAQGALQLEDQQLLHNRLGIPVREYSVKPELPVFPTDPIKKSVTTIISTFLRVAEQNEQGILADLDTEFLHDYRVSFRKVRSALSLFSGVYSKKETVRLKREFSELMKRTSRLRDLDVYLLERKRYFELVPQSSHEGLDILFSLLQRERRVEHRRLCKLLRSKNYKKSFESWKRLFGDVDNLSDGALAGKPSSVLAAERIWKRYKKVCRIARLINDKTEDAVVHELRIECKKLRYLMEFSTPFFPRKKIKKLIRSLKKLQDNLGRFNDYSVQQHFPGEFLGGKMKKSDKGIKMAEAIGALTAMHYRLQCQERNQVMENFARFDNEKVRMVFRELFKKPE